MTGDGFEAQLAPLWRAGLQGDEAAYRAALLLMAARLRAVYRRRLGSLPDEVEDLVQETLLAIHAKRDSHDPALPVSNWLHAIARYRLVDLHRRRGRREALTDEYLDTAADPDALSAEAGTARRDLGRLLGTLPDGTRQAIELTKVQGLSVDEASARMGITATTLKVRVHRGLARLAQMVAGTG
jgi:RNA polymerase sigma-70 factor, ECF subfamily